MQVVDPRSVPAHLGLMSFSNDINRMPIPFQPDIGAEVVADYAALPAPFRSLVEGTAGCSPYLAGLLRQERDWLCRVESEGADALVQGLWADMESLQPDQIKPGLRQAKRRLALLAAMADLGGVWSLEQVTQALTDLADRAVQVAMTSLLTAELARGKLPGMTSVDLETSCGMAVLAMGKMGAGELNYSSDIDLICLFDETRFGPDDYVEARASFVRVTRKLVGFLSDATADGYVFRTDLRLRPDASVTPVCIAMEAAERYYESVGRTWERAAFIKARPCAGDLAAGQAFLDRLTPFVWRRHLDFAAIQDAHDMRLRIRGHKGLRDVVKLPGHNMKLGMGGIREIEFFTQTRQIIAGGRDPLLRVRGTVDGLARLEAAGWITADVIAELTQAYRAHREVEHRLQMIGDAQTHDLPTTDDGFERLAQFMGHADTAKFKQDLYDRLGRVARMTEDFFAPGQSGQCDRAEIDNYVERWRSLPALRSARAVEIFKRVFPRILAQLNAALKPEEAIAEFERFLTGLPAGVQLFSLFEANPPLTQLIADICATAPALAAYLSQNSGVLDAVLGGGFFADWPEHDVLQAEFDALLARHPDYETKLDAARIWQKEWHFRIGVHHLRGLISPERAGQQYSDLASVVVAGLFDPVITQFALKHGPPPGRGAILLGMGSLGAGRLSATSDLDLIMIYDDGGQEASIGPRPLPSRSYFARLTQAMITALSAPTAKGRLYEVDMRLRPSGQAGPVATSLAAYKQYQANEAWVWEHMALTRARPISGPPALRRDVAQVRSDVVSRGHAPDRILAETAEMRKRLAEAGRVGGLWVVKDGYGGQQDIELLAQGAALAAGEVSYETNTQLAAAEQLGWITPDACALLQDAHRLFWRIRQAARLLTGGTLDPGKLSDGGRAMVLRDAGMESLADLEKTLVRCRKQAKDAVETALASGADRAK